VQAGEAARISTLVGGWLDGFERARPPFTVAGTEVATALTLEGLALRLRIDRIDAPDDGGIVIIDYKTGVAPTAAQAKAGFASQLTLEAAMVERGGFADVGAREVDGALYLKLGGAGGGKEVSITPKDTAFPDLVAAHWNELQAMLDSYRDASRGYVSRPFVQFASRYSDYDHLARVKEWSAAGGGSEGGE
jgi:ATP-dependent helicase/nuclease subunit B